MGFPTRALIAAVTLAMLVALPLASDARAASARDVAATRAYLRADYRLVQAGVAKIPKVEAALRGVLARVRRECPRAAAGSPQNAQSTELSNEVIGALVTAVVHLDLPAGRAFVRSVRPLRWSSARLTAQVQAYAGHVRTLVGLAEPHLCADVRAWAASGFRTLPATTTAFAPRFMDAWVALGELPGGLAASTTGGERGLVASIKRMEGRFTDLEAREVATWGATMTALELWP